MTRVIRASEMLATPRVQWLPQWSEFAARVDQHVLPAVAVERAKLVVLDCIGAIVGGMQEPELRAIVDKRAAGGVSPVIGTGRFASPGDAAFLNGVAGTTLELDEGNQFARGHPAIHVVPAILAKADASHDGMSVIRSLVAGYEIGSRVGIASKLRTTMHPHGTWGTIGAALASATLTREDAPTIANVINIAAGLSLATSRRTMLEGATVRNCFSGLSNQLGLLAHDLGKAGFQGEADAVATVYGDGIVADEFDPALMTDGLGERWEIARNYFKVHAACRYTHAVLDVVQRLVAEHGPLPVDDVVSIDVDTYVWAAQLDAPAPKTMLAAKFSIPFAIATTLAHGEASPLAFRADALNDKAILDLASRITVREDEAMTASLPAERPARATISMGDGRILTGETRINRGDTEDPFPPEMIVDKFRSLVVPVWGERHAEAVIAQTMQLDTMKSVSPFLHLLAQAPVSNG